MTSGRIRLALAAGAFVATLVARPCPASERGYDVWFAGRVLSVDAQRERLRVARGPTETAGRGIEECVAAGADLKLVRPGMLIEAQADTRRRPWRLLHLHVMERKIRRPEGIAPGFAFNATSSSPRITATRIHAL